MVARLRNVAGAHAVKQACSSTMTAYRRSSCQPTRSLKSKERQPTAGLHNLPIAFTIGFRLTFTSGAGSGASTVDSLLKPEIILSHGASLP
jgi:hypothetical protein